MAVSIEERNIFIEGHYRLNYHRLVGYMARRIGPNNAEDAVQEAYCRALMYFDAFTPGEDFDLWFMAIWENAGHKIMNEIEETNSDELAELVVAIPPAAEHVYELSLIQHKLKDEMPEHRQAIINHLILGYTAEETGRMLGMPENTVFSVVHRFREKLQ
jgi:RNA polymerase sigma factor (sigma-70 family)